MKSMTTKNLKNNRENIYPVEWINICLESSIQIFIVITLDSTKTPTSPSLKILSII